MAGNGNLVHLRINNTGLYVLYCFVLVDKVIVLGVAVKLAI